MIDTHLHVWEHRPGTPVPTYDQLAAYCERAADNGVETIAITEHCNRFERIVDEVLIHWERPQSGPLAAEAHRATEAERGADLDAYVEALMSAKDRGLPILVGMEVDYLPGTVEAMGTVLGEYPFDFLLGSVHWLDAWLFDDYGNEVFAAEWDRRDVAQVWEAYIDAVVILAHSGLVDALAHIDVIKVTGRYPDPATIDRLHQRLVKEVASAGVAVEVSSAGLRKPCAEIYPAPDLLRALVDAGVPLTLASDAHTVESVAQHHAYLQQVLDELGVSTLTMFSGRQPVVV